MTGTHGSEGAPARKPAGATRLGDDALRGGQADAGYLIEARGRVSERADHLPDPGVHGGDAGADRIDAGQHGAQQERVMAGEVAGERFFQHGDLPSHGVPGEAGQDLGVAFAGDQGGHHVPARNREDVGGDGAQLDLGILEQLPGPLLLRGARGHQVGAVAGQVPESADLRWRDEARAAASAARRPCTATPHPACRSWAGPAGA